MLKTFMTASLALAVVAGSTLATTGTAEARDGRHAAFAAGAIGALVLGGIIANEVYRPRYYGEPVYYEEGPYCRLVQKTYWNGARFKKRTIEVCD